MNERIKLLAHSAWVDNDPWADNDHLDACGHVDLEKFAELIVKECVQTLLDNTPEQFTNEAAEEDWDRGYGQAMRDCVHHIIKHFGVEE